MINFDEFKKMDLRVARVIEAEKVKDSEKLLKLKVDLGDEKRQIVAGISQFYQPEDLIGKEIVIIANLESKILAGIKSQGMVLTAESERPTILRPEEEVPPGTKIS